MTLPLDTLPRARGAFRDVPFMGVIFVVAEAVKLGFQNGHPDWCNLGQGQPEVGDIPGAPPRVQDFSVQPGDHAYGPVEGTLELREKVAEHVNRLYRRGHASQYTAEHVCISSGGRLALTRIFAALGDVSLGYQVPDYTAYEDMIAYHMDRVRPVAIHAPEASGFKVSPDQLRASIEEHDLGAYVVSNPCNPTGQVVRDGELAEYVEIARQSGCALVLDEFYSHFVYDGDRPAAGPVSGAPFIEDVDRDPVLLVDGLTKSYRYPGWRLGWTVGPPAMIDNITRAASAIDGGPSTIVQRAALRALEPERADQETEAVRQVFSRKRNLMQARLAEMGIECARESDGTFYVWASIARLPEPFRDGMSFFRRALEHKVMTVPGVFFDVNPRKERPGPSPFESWVRFSFGPPEDNVREGLSRLESMLRGA